MSMFQDESSVVTIIILLFFCIDGGWNAGFGSRTSIAILLVRIAKYFPFFQLEEGSHIRPKTTSHLFHIFHSRPKTKTKKQIIITLKTIFDLLTLWNLRKDVEDSCAIRSVSNCATIRSSHAWKGQKWHKCHT